MTTEIKFKGIVIDVLNTPDEPYPPPTVCDRCGHTMQTGEWPFCPHPMTERGLMIQRDEIPGGMVVENYGPHPIKFYSHSERRNYMKQHGLREKETFCPMPGTDKDPQGIPNPMGYMDPQTLENARILVSRNGRQESPKEFSTGVLVNFTKKTISFGEVIRLIHQERFADYERRASGVDTSR